MQTISKFLAITFFMLEIGTVLAYLTVQTIQENRMTPVIIIFAGLFTVIFFFAGMVENHNNQQGADSGNIQADDLHRAYQQGYSALERNQERQERAYQAQLAAQERQHTTTVNAFVALSLADKQLLCDALRAGIRLVEADRQLFFRYANGQMQSVSQLEDMTPDKCRYMAAAQQRLELANEASNGYGGNDRNVVEGVYREF